MPKKWHRLFVAVFIALIAVVLILTAVVIEHTWWVYGVYILLAALLGVAIGLIFDALFPAEEMHNDNEDDDF